eukprot:contig_14096_g3378
MTVCCGCKHPVVLTFSVLDGKEAPQVLLNILIKRFLKASRFLVHDLGCGVFCAALGKIAWLLAYRTIVSGGFHSFNQLCSNLFDPRSYRNMDGVGTGAPEQRNAPIQSIQGTLRGTGVPNYTALLACQTGILNRDAQVRWKMGVDRLPDNADLAQVAFEQFSCS